MSSDNKRSNRAHDLRTRAEKKVSKLSSLEKLPVEEARRLVHELRVHQIELEMQNEALREAQAELLETSSRYTDLYDFAPVGFLTVDENAFIREANLTFAKQLGIERGLLEGFLFTNFFVPGYRDTFRQHLARIFKSRERQTIEAKLTWNDGKNEFFALIESIFMEDAHGRKQCRISVTDISGRKRAEKITRLYMEKLEQSNRQLQEFAFIASHDLQEPLRKIQTFGAQLKRKHSQALDQNGHDYLNRMVNAAKRMSEMIRGLLDFSRVGTETCRFGTVDLSGIIREVKDDLEILIKQSGAFIQVGRLPSIEADSNQMRRLFQNLVINAIKFHGEEKPSIKIYTVLDESGSHRIFVEDNGIGFDEQYAERIFILFQRLHGRSTHDGTGMGLAICRKIVELHHGSITARSKPGQGSTFIITLPEKQPIES